MDSKGHGRTENWRVRSCSIDPLEVDFPHARCAIRVHHSGIRDGKHFDETRYYISNRQEHTHSLKVWLQHIRNHWAGVENRLHWRKDACLREDHTRSRNPNIVGALGLLRNALFAIHQPHLENYGGLNGFTEAVAADSFFAYRLITRPL